VTSLFLELSIDGISRWTVGGMLLLRIRVRLLTTGPNLSSDDLVFYSAIDRVHRIGQEKTVYVKHFIVNLVLHSMRT
jgi:hypothetical protein